MTTTDPINDIDAETSEIQTETLGFCMCGSPEDNLRYILGALEIIGSTDPERYQSMRRYFGGYDRAMSFFLYWADKENLTEHGGSILGCWLSDAGTEMLNRLRAWNAALTPPPSPVS